MIKVRRRTFNVLSCCQPDEVFTCSVDAIKRRLNNDYDYDLILKCNSSREYCAMCVFVFFCKGEFQIEKFNVLFGSIFSLCATLIKASDNHNASDEKSPKYNAKTFRKYNNNHFEHKRKKREE